MSLKYSEYNDLIRKKNKGNIRILTYNVHGFKSRKWKKTYLDILQVIHNINPDILIIQEVYIYKKNEHIKQETLINDLHDQGFKHFQFTRSGINMICTRKRFDFDSIELDFGPDPINGISRFALVAKLKNTDLSIVGTHLDVFDESGETRKEQINFLLEHLKSEKINNVVIAGDFNTLRKNDYSDPEWKYITECDKLRNVTTKEDIIPIIENNNFRESFDAVNKKLKVSVWSNRRVDYIYGKNINFIDSACYRSIASDHHPIYADIKLAS